MPIQYLWGPFKTQHNHHPVKSICVWPDCLWPKESKHQHIWLPWQWRKSSGRQWREEKKRDTIWETKQVNGTRLSAALLLVLKWKWDVEESLKSSCKSNENWCIHIGISSLGTYCTTGLSSSSSASLTYAFLYSVSIRCLVLVLQSCSLSLNLKPFTNMHTHSAKLPWSAKGGRKQRSS